MPITSFLGLKIAHCVQREYICSLVLLAVDEKCKIYAPSSYSLSTLFLMRRICKWVHHVEMGVPKQIPHPRILISSMIASSLDSNMAAAASILWLVAKKIYLSFTSITVWHSNPLKNIHNLTYNLLTGQRNHTTGFLLKKINFMDGCEKKLSELHFYYVLTFQPS